jgi:hypothetical protein
MIMHSRFILTIKIFVSYNRESVFSLVGTEFLNIAQMNFRLHKINRHWR